MCLMTENNNTIRKLNKQNEGQTINRQDCTRAATGLAQNKTNVYFAPLK